LSEGMQAESDSTIDLPQTTLQHTATHGNTLQHTATAH